MALYRRMRVHKIFGVLLVLISWIVNTIEESRGPGYNTPKISTDESGVNRGSVSRIPTFKSSDMKNESVVENIESATTHYQVPQVPLIFYAKLNTGLFVQTDNNKTVTPAVIEATTGRFPVEEGNTQVIFEGVTDEPFTTTSSSIHSDTENYKWVEIPSLTDSPNDTQPDYTETLHRSELYNRESDTYEYIDCNSNICTNSYDITPNEEIFQRAHIYEPKVSVKMLMPPEDTLFYLSSDTLQDIWQNHINANSVVPLDIVETSASELVEFYLPPPDPSFTVPHMTSPSAGEKLFSNHNAQYGFTAQQPSYSTGGNQEDRHHGPSFPVHELFTYPTATPTVIDPVIARPPPLYSYPYVPYAYQPQSHNAPDNSPLGAASSNKKMQVINQPPQYRVISPNTFIGSRVQQPFPMNHSFISMGVRDIIGKIPPSLVIHSPTNMPTLQLINAVTGAIPGMMHHGVDLQDMPRGQIRFPGQKFPMALQPPATLSTTGVLGTQNYITPNLSSIADDSGDTRVVIRLKQETTTQSPTITPDSLGYSEVDLKNGKKIRIRVIQEESEPPSKRPDFPNAPQHSENQSLGPTNSQRASGRPKRRRRPFRRFPHRRRPADDRFSFTGITKLKGDPGSMTGAGKGNSVQMYNTNSEDSEPFFITGDISSGNQMNNAGESSMYNMGSSQMQSGYQGSSLNNGQGGLFNKGGLGNILRDLQRKNPFNKGNLGNILEKFNKGNLFDKGNIFNKGEFGAFADKFSNGNIFDKGSIEGLKNEIASGVNQVQSKFQNLVEPLQTKVDSSFQSAVGFLQVLFGNIIPGNYYEDVLTILAILAFIAFVHVRLSIMINSLTSSSSITFGLLGKAEEILSTINESNQMKVIQDLASDVYRSIELWAEESLDLPSSWTSNLFFTDKISSLFSSASSKGTDEGDDSNFVRKTLYMPVGNESATDNGEDINYDLTSEVLGEVDGVARLGSTLVDVTWRQGGLYAPVTKSACLQRHLCDLNTMSDKEGGLSSLLIPLTSIGVSWFNNPPVDAFTLLDTFRPLWLSNTDAQGEGCKRIHPCTQHS